MYTVLPIQICLLEIAHRTKVQSNRGKHKSSDCHCCLVGWSVVFYQQDCCERKYFTFVTPIHLLDTDGWMQTSQFRWMQFILEVSLNLPYNVVRMTKYKKLKIGNLGINLIHSLLFEILDSKLPLETWNPENSRWSHINRYFSINVTCCLIHTFGVHITIR